MSAAQPTKVFGMQIGLDPKILVAVLLVVAGVVYYFNSQSDERPSSPGAPAPAALNRGVNIPNGSAPERPAVSARRSANVRTNEKLGLKLVPIDGSRGDVDPTLRLKLLEKVRSVGPAIGLRNLFEGGMPEIAPSLKQIAKIMPKTPPPPMPVAPTVTTPPPPPPFNIPLKYYGFAKPAGRTGDGNRGLFLDGDNILMGGEGDVLEKHYLIVALSANSARLEDTERKQGQDLPVTPAATSQ